MKCIKLQFLKEEKVSSKCRKWELKQVRKLQNEQYQVEIPNVGNLSQSSIVVFTDASHANLEGGASQAGHLIFIKGPNGNAALIAWTSRKLKRVVQSPMAAETLALEEGANLALLIRTTMCEYLDIDPLTISIRCFSDSSSTCDAVNSTNVLEDKRLMIDMCCLREMVGREGITVQWLKGCKQLADCLTKSSASSEMLVNVVSGKDTLTMLND